jgi:hypothetical protein
MNYLKLVIKTTCIAQHLSDHAVSPPHVKRFRQPAVASWKLSEHHLLPTSFQLFHKPTLSVRSYRYTGEKLSSLASIESFEFLTPFKICFTYDSPYELCKK